MEAITIKFPSDTLNSNQFVILNQPFDLPQGDMNINIQTKSRFK